MALVDVDTVCYIRVPSQSLYNSVNKTSAIRTLDRISSPGLRKYTGIDTMPRVLNGLGIAIISTSKGVMTDKEAKAQNVGGEVLCNIY